MKVFILFTILAAASAQTYRLNPGQTACGPKAATDQNNFNRGSNAVMAAAAAVYGYAGPCEYWQTCETVTGVFQDAQRKSITNPEDVSYRTKYVCLNKGNVLCHRYSDLSGGGTIVATQQCSPSQKCCQGECCELFSESCMLRTEGPFNYGWSEAQVKAEYDFRVGSDTTKFWHRAPYQADRVSRNDWKTDMGSVANQPKYCAANTVYMNTAAGLKVIYIPTLGVLITLWAIMAVKNNGKLDKSQTFAPCTMLVCALLGWFSIYQSHYMFGMFIAVFTACAPANWTSWILFFQLILFWWFLGGNSFILNPAGPAASALLPNTDLLADTIVQAATDPTNLNGNDMTTCGGYFNFFGFENANNAGGNGSQYNGATNPVAKLATYTGTPDTPGTGACSVTTATACTADSDCPPNETCNNIPQPQAGNPAPQAAGNMKWWSSTNRRGWGYCSYEWIGFQQFLCVTHIVAFFVMVIQTGIRTMNGGDGGGGFTEAIVTRQTSKV